MAPNLFLGSRAVPTIDRYVREILGITTVLTTPQQQDEFTSLGLDVLTLEVGDEFVYCDMATQWDKACDWIDGVLAAGGTMMILVHGRSRSASFALAWLVRA